MRRKTKAVVWFLFNLSIYFVFGKYIFAKSDKFLIIRLDFEKLPIWLKHALA